MPVTPRNDRERLDWLRLSRSENIRPVTFRMLIERYGSAAAALEAVPSLARRGGRQGPIKLCPLSEAEAEAEALTRHGGQLLTLYEPAYPRLLAAVEDAPPILSIYGQLHLTARRMVALVGARNASAAGIRMARRLASELGGAGLVVVSGLARGIDAAAHEASLASGTAAVLAGGIDNVYPPEHDKLYAAISRQGLIMSEMAFGTSPQARHFPRRNRIVSGLAEGVVVVEAAERSGSLITARFALEQGRDVLAVPGSPLDPRAQGTNKLIRAGAILVQSAADVLEALNEPARQRLFEPPAAGVPGAPLGPVDDRAVDAARAAVEEKLSHAPVEIDEIVRQTGLAPSIILGVLLELELAGRIERQSGQYVVLR